MLGGNQGETNTQDSTKRSTLDGKSAGLAQSD